MINKAVYPAKFTLCPDGTYFVEVPDLGVMTQGTDLANAIVMARDVIKLTILELEERKEEVPAAGSVALDAKEGILISYVDIDMKDYRERYGSKSVKKNCTIPQWLSSMAEEQGLNFSKVLQEALMAKLSC